MCNITIAYVGGNYRNFVGVGAIMQGIELALTRTRASCFLVLADGRGMMIGLYDNTLRVWNSMELTGPGRTLVGHTFPATCMAELTGGGRVVSASGDETLRLHIMRGHMGSVICLAVLADGSAASGGHDDTIRIWNTSTGECTRVLTTTMSVRGLGQLGDGRLVTGSELDPRVKFWDLITGQCTQTGVPDDYRPRSLNTPAGHDGCCVTCVLPLTNGRVVTGSCDRTLDVWDVATMQRIHTLRGHKALVIQLVELPDGRVVSGAFDGEMRVWDTSTGTLSLTLAAEDGAWFGCMALLPSGHVLSSWSNCKLRVWS
jgi:WD40 repeat protein